MRTGHGAKDAYLRYLTTLLTLGGRSESQAAEEAAAYFALEKELAGAMMDRQDYGNADRIYNVSTMEQLQAIFRLWISGRFWRPPGLAADDKILVAGSRDCFRRLRPISTMRIWNC